MGQSFFDFKQFRVEQGACGMKVTTDACIQGRVDAVARWPMLYIGYWRRNRIIVTNAGATCAIGKDRCAGN